MGLDSPDKCTDYDVASFCSWKFVPEIRNRLWLWNDLQCLATGRRLRFTSEEEWVEWNGWIM